MLYVMNLNNQRLERLIEVYKPLGVKEEFIRQSIYLASQEASEASALLAMDLTLSEDYNHPRIFSDYEVADMFGFSIFEYRLRFVKYVLYKNIENMKRYISEKILAIQGA